MEEKQRTIHQKALDMMQDPIAMMVWEKWIAEGKAKVITGDQNSDPGVHVVVTFDQDEPEEYPMTEAYIEREKSMVREVLLDLLKNDKEFRALFIRNRQSA